MCGRVCKVESEQLQAPTPLRDRLQLVNWYVQLRYWLFECVILEQANDDSEVGSGVAEVR